MSTWLTKTFRSLLTLVVLLATSLVARAASADCTTGGQYPAVPIAMNLTGAVTSISTCSFAGEYSAISNIIVGQDVTLDATANIGYITVRAGAPGGPTLAAGAPPLTFTSTYSGTIYAHWTVDANCGSNSSCHTTNVQCAHCAGRPTVTAISPDAGLTSGGTSVTITGAGFAGASVVKIGGNAVTTFTVVSDTTITATTAAHGFGPASVEVTGAVEPSEANQLFTYVAPTVSSASPTSVFGQSVTLTAHVDGAPVGGVVTFADGATTLGSSNLDIGFDTSFTTSSLPVGDHAITASYHGASSTAITQTVNKADTSTALDSSMNPSIINGNVDFSVVVSVNAPGAGVPDGSVVFSDNGVPLGTAVALVNGAASLSTSALKVGSHTITADYTPGAGGSFNSGTQTMTQTVNVDGTSVDFVSSSNPSTFGEPMTFTATLSSESTGGVPSGTVSFYDGGSLLGTAPLAAGVASFETTTLGGGSHKISASYDGDSVHDPVSASLTQVVNKVASSVALTTSTNASEFGQSVVFTATIAGPGASGTVTFKSTVGGTETVLGSAAVTDGVASLTTTALSVGSLQIVASYGGDANYESSASAPLAHVVGKASTTVALTSSHAPSTPGESVTFTATVTSAAPGISGEVEFFAEKTSLGKSALVVDGSNPLKASATFATSALAIGSHSISAVFSGSATHQTDTSIALEQDVSEAASTTPPADTAAPAGAGGCTTTPVPMTNVAALVPAGLALLALRRRRRRRGSPG